MSFESFDSKIGDIKTNVENRREIKKFDPDQRIDSSENQISFSDKAKGFDPDQRIDRNEGMVSENETRFDPDQRVEIKDVQETEEITVVRIKCKNEYLEGKKHPDTGVMFERKQVEVDSILYEGVFPRFDSTYDAKLPVDKLQATDYEQFKECNVQLKEAVANNKELRERFEDEQLEQIENGDTPDGYTWNHDAEVGKMQLVDIETHQKTGHTGGRLLWGGGTEKR